MEEMKEIHGKGNDVEKNKEEVAIMNNKVSQFSYLENRISNYINFCVECFDRGRKAYL